MTWPLEPTDTATGRFPAGARDAVSRSGPRCATVMVARRRTSPPQRPNIGPQSVRPLVSFVPVPVSTRQVEAQFQPHARRLRLISPFQDG